MKCTDGAQTNKCVDKRNKRVNDINKYVNCSAIVVAIGEGSYSRRFFIIVIEIRDLTRTDHVCTASLCVTCYDMLIGFREMSLIEC